MPLNFPNSPVDGQIYTTPSGDRYSYSSSVGAWLSVAESITGNTLNGQIIYNSSNDVGGSNGLLYLATSNTVALNNVSVTLNVSAQYFYGNGAFLTGIVTDFSPAFNQANTARTHANNAYAQANTANITADLAFNKANTANITADLAYGQANTARTHANAAHLTANAGFDQANTARVHANAAFLQANTALSTGQSAFNAANIAWATANGRFSSNGGTITGDVSIVGTLSISGNTILQNVTTLTIGDPLIYLAANNYISDIVDIGFIANYVNATGSNVHTGLYREHEDKMYYLFRDYDREPANNHIGALSNNMTIAVLNADLRTSNILLAGANAVLWIRGSYEQANTARTHANNAFNTANNALANTSGITFGGVLNVSGNVTSQGLNVTSNVISFGTAMSILANGMVIINGDINML